MSPNFVLKALGQRRTYKTIGDPNNPEKPRMQNTEGVKSLLQAAGNAPFHVPCDRSHQTTLGSIVPWRVYALDAKNCRQLMQRLIDNGDTTKLPAMLAASEYLFQVTWLPDPHSSHGLLNPSEPFEPTLRNMEHIASASAVAQSLLLAGEAEGYRTYWSSGGALRSDAVFGWLDIPSAEILIGSVFLFGQTPEHAEVKPGSHANNRGKPEDWSRWPELD